MKTYQRRRIVWAIYGAILALGGGIYASQVAWAEGQGGSGGSDAATGKCTVKNDTWCGAFGVAWRRYSAEDMGIKDNRDDIAPYSEESRNALAQAASVCSGAGEFFMLAYEQVDAEYRGSVPTVYRYDDKIGNPVSVHQVNSTVAGEDSDGSYNYVFLTNDTTGLSSLLGWDDVKSKYDMIPSDVISSSDAFTAKSWGDTSWFCWDEEEWGYDDVEESETGQFQSASGVQIDDQGIGEQWSDKDDKVTVKVSTNSVEFPVKFKHKIYYSGEYKDAKTELEYSGSGEDEDGGEFSVKDKANLDSEGSLVKTQDVKIKLNPGDTKTVCRSVSYDPKNISISKTGKQNSDGELIGDWTYGAVSSSGSGSSTACVEVYRPKDPGDNGDGPSSSGSGTSSVWFAGETATLGWKATADATQTRRVTQYQPIGFLVKDNVTVNTDTLSGDFDGTSSDPCAYYTGKLGESALEYCNDLTTSYTSSGISEEQQKQSYTVDNDNLSVVVPDGVGYKYCNSLGFKWQYWWGVQKGEGDTTWTQATGRDYWTNYDAVCRTIAKKPSVAIWNSSIFSGSAITSTLAPRVNTTTMGSSIGTITSNSDSAKAKTTYGSWVEHSLIANGEVRGLTSGASLAQGRVGALTTGFDASLSMLTIANDALDTNHTLGNAGINLSSSIFITRLEAYLKNGQEVEKVSKITGLNALTKGQMKVYVADGDLEITGNIINETENYKNIYEIPQVIIFAEKEDARINISGDVTRIDAWIIAPKATINTCANLAKDTGTKTINNSGTSILCDKQLKLNGPIVARSLKLNRTFGADAYSYSESSKKYTSAEIFNLSGASYLWAYAQAGRYASSYSETYSRELAPRY